MHPSYRAKLALARPARIGIALGLILAFPRDLKSETRPQFLDLIAAINHGSNAEGAESHGALGMKLGFGLETVPIDQEDTMSRENFNLPSESGVKTLGLPRVIVTKGLFIPVDLAVSAAFIDNRRLTQLTGQAQWTIFEGFRLPALALRAGAHRIYGLGYASLRTLTGDLVLSFGLGGFSFYGSYGWGWHSAAIRRSKSSEDLFLAQRATTNPLNQNWRDEARSLGFRIMIVPMVALGFEARAANKSPDIYTLVLSLGT